MVASAPNTQGRIFLRSYRIRQTGLRGANVSIPMSWLEDQGLKFGDKIDAYQTFAGEIVLVPRRSAE